MNATRQENCQVLEFPLPSGKTARYDKKSVTVFFYSSFLSSYVPSANLSVEDIYWTQIILKPLSVRDKLISKIFTSNQLLHSLKKNADRFARNVFSFISSMSEADILKFTQQVQENPII